MKGWILVISLWAMAAGALMQATQGTYEDHQQVDLYNSLTATAPRFWTARGLTKWTIWRQVRRQASPAAMRVGNLAIAAAVCLVTGALAWAFGLPAWIAAGAMAAHPLTTEAIATLSGRGELFAALGLVGACFAVCAPRLSVWRVLACAACLGLGYLGKESIAIALPLVPLTYAARARRSGWYAVAGVLALGVAAWPLRGVGLLLDTSSVSGWTWFVRQGGAGFRLLTLAPVPWHQTIDADIDALAWIWCLSACACLVVLVGACHWLWQRGDRIPALGLVWMLAPILPRVIIRTPKSYMNEHQFYPALIGLSLILAWAVTRWEVTYEVSPQEKI